MARFVERFQEWLKSTTGHLLLFACKLFSGAAVGLTLSLIFQELIGFGTFSFVLVIVVITLALLRVMRFWGWSRLLIFDLICVLLALLLRMYILIAPGA